MVCPSCSLDNDPSSAFCARCNAALTLPAPTTPGPVRPAPYTGSEPSAAYAEEPRYAEQAAQFRPTAPARPRRSAGGWPIAVVGIVLVLVAGGVTAFVLHDGDAGAETTPTAPTNVVPAPESPTPVEESTTVEAPTTEPGDPQSQAAAVDSLLDDSTASRRKLNEGIDLVNRCTRLSRAVSDLREVGIERRAQLDSLQSMDLSALPDGERIRSTLSDALRNSIDADAAFVRWAEGAQGNGCQPSGQRSADYADGRRLSTQARAAKVAFLAIWNPVASVNGLPARSEKYI
jgi:hypothetical protein